MKTQYAVKGALCVRCGAARDDVSPNVNRSQLAVLASVVSPTRCRRVPLPTEGLWRSAVGLALRHDHAAYDAVSVAAAESLGTRVLTFDRGLLAAYPDLALHARG